MYAVLCTVVNLVAVYYWHWLVSLPDMTSKAQMSHIQRFSNISGRTHVPAGGNTSLSS